MQLTIKDTVHRICQGIGLLLSAISPLGLLGFLIGFFSLIGNTISHFSYLRSLERWSYTTSAVVEYRHTDGNEVSVSFIGKVGDERYATLKDTYCPPERWEMRDAHAGYGGTDTRAAHRCPKFQTGHFGRHTRSYAK